MQKAHQNINWENTPSLETPLNETNLNLMDRSIDTIDDRVIAMDVSKANQSDLLQTVKTITYNASNGVFTIIFFNGTSTTIDTDIEKIAINFDYDDDPTSPTYQKIIIELEDGTYKYIDLSALITEYEFVASSTITPTVNNGNVSMDIIDGSVTDQKMQPNYLADITVQASASASAASSASASKQDSEAWAVGTRNGAPVQYGDPTYQNNAKYYAQHGAGTSFSGLADTDFDNLQNGQVPIYDAENQLWINGTPEAGILPKLVITGEAGSTITILSPSSEQITPTAISATIWSADVKEYGDYLITASKDGSIVQKTVSVNVVQVYNVTMAFFEAFITVTFPTGATVSCATTGQETQYATTSPYTFTVNASGTYTITGTRSGITETQTVVITTSGQTESVTLSILPNGSTVTPTDDVQILLNCADIWDKTSYTTISELIADDTSLLKVLTSDNAIDYLVRSTTFASAITADADAMSMIGSYDYCADTLLSDSTWASAILGSTYKDSVINTTNPTMTGYTTPSGTASASSEYDTTTYQAWKAFDNNTSTQWHSAVQGDGWVQYQFPFPVTVVKAEYYVSSAPTSIMFKASADGFVSDVHEVTESLTNISAQTLTDVLFSKNVGKYDYYRMALANNSYVMASKIKFYGRQNSGVQSWLRSGGITDKSYTTLAEVLADTTTLSALISSHDAVDYLVTAKGLIDGIVADAMAMSYIGLNNYCANTLLADAEWLSGIANSTYKESVLNAKNPTMTSATTPSGECFASSQYQPAWQAFDSNDASFWETNNVGSAIVGEYVGYKFPQAVCIKTFDTIFGYRGATSSNITFKIQASNDNSTWTDLAENLQSNANARKQFILNNDNAYTYYRAYITGYVGSTRATCYDLRFYGREDV